MRAATGLYRLWVGALCAVALAACSSGVVPYQEFDARTHIVGPLYSSAGIAELNNALRAAAPRPIRALRLHIFPHHAVLEAQDPRAPAEVNRYRFRGAVIETEPVVDPDLDEADLFTLEAVALDALPRLIDDAVRAFGEPGADVTSVSIGRAAGTLRISASVRSPRATGTVNFDANGTLLPTPG